MLKLISRIKKKVVSPKMYAVTVISQQYTRLWMGFAYSLDEAVGNARQEATKAIPAYHGLWQLQLYGSIEAKQLIENMTSHKVTETVLPQKEKTVVPLKKAKVVNKLLHNIIASGDKTLIENNKELLTKAEISFLKEKMNK